MLAEAISEGEELALNLASPLERHLLPEVAGVVADYDSRSYRLFERKLLIGLWKDPENMLTVVTRQLLESSHIFSRRFTMELNKRPAPGCSLFDKVGWAAGI